LPDLSSTSREYRQTVGCIVRRHGETELCVISVLVELNTVTHDDVGSRTAVYCEQQRTKDGLLRNADIESDGW